MSEKLQKVLAQLGLASRRKIEEWIREGRILVNGRVAELGCRITKKEKIMVDGKPVQFLESIDEPRIIIYHKPIGEICTRSDPEGRPTVFSHLPVLHQGRWIGVGRLDFNTSGLMLFTNDGELANRLMHPRSKLARAYLVRVFGEITIEMLKRLRKNVTLEDGPAHFEEIIDSGGEGLNHWYQVVVMEGRNRLVRRLWESQGVQVSRLKRIRFGPVSLEAKLRAGRWAELDNKAYKQLLAISRRNS